LRGKLVRCRQVDVMNEPLRPAANAEGDREDAKQERGCEAEHGMSVEAARREAEQVRQLAEDARDVRDQQREALETIRQERERLRDTAETARAANEQNWGRRRGCAARGGGWCARYCRYPERDPRTYEGGRGDATDSA
jgi:hypothetical protein